jgi:hypothetical protein
MSNPISVPALANQVDELRAEGHDNAAIERDISRYLQEQDLTQEEILEKTQLVVEFIARRDQELAEGAERRA